MPFVSLKGYCETIYKSLCVLQTKGRKHDMWLFILFLKIKFSKYFGLAKWLSRKEPACQRRRYRRRGFDPRVGKMPWRREWHPAPVFLPGEFHGQRSLVGYSSCSHKESDMTEHAGCKYFNNFEYIFLTLKYLEKWKKMYGFTHILQKITSILFSFCV